MTGARTDIDESRLGEVLREGERVKLRYERHLAHPPEKVWRALTESEQLRHWFPADIVGERQAGAALELRFWPETVADARDEIEAIGVDPNEATLPGEMRVWDPPRVLELTWDTDVLRYELEPDGVGTRLLFTTWLAEPGPTGTSGTAAGYHVCLDSLGLLLDTGSATTRGADTAALERRYAALAGEGDTPLQNQAMDHLNE
jgi:uncharacterized protein YndB with AHSA1/START domain